MSGRRVGVIGTGQFGQHHVRILSSLPECRLIGIYDTDRNRAEYIAKQFNTQAFSTQEELLDSVEAVSIVTPTIHHSAVAVEAISRGIHTLVEKPIAASVREADKILEASASYHSGVFLAVGQLERFNPAYTAAIRQFEGLKFFRAERLGPWVGTNIDVDIIIDLMIHDIDLLISLDPSPPMEIRAVGATVLADSPDIANAWITLESETVAMLDASRTSERKHRIIRLYSNSEYLSIDLLNRKAKRTRKAGDDNRVLEREEIKVPEAEPLLEELKAFIAAIDGAETPLATGKQGRDALALATTISQAISKS